MNICFMDHKTCATSYYTSVVKTTSSSKLLNNTAANLVSGYIVNVAGHNGHDYYELTTELETEKVSVS